MFLCINSITKWRFTFQLSYKHLRQSFDQWELEHVSCICADILYCQHECDLPALSGQHMCEDRRGQLRACECNNYTTFSMEGVKVNGYCWMIFAHPCLFHQDCRQKTRRSSQNIVRSAFHSGPLHKSNEGKIFLDSVFVCLVYWPCKHS